ncbi:hypothetical protein [Novosphingobium sp. ZW T3_23]|uniref:hypothetical protein n=1 Tax=Novosphingobium sp. ZW T3_23 TaxID=3378084 RepID=UPI0038553603
MAEQLPPYWAYVRSCELSGGAGIEERLYDHDCAFTKQTLAFARYIAAHEDEPVDPCVEAGRRLVAETQHNFPDSPWHITEAAETIAGNRDCTLIVMAAIEGVRRGIEIGKAQA